MASRIAAKALDSKPTKLYVSLKGLPRAALPNDLRRLCGRTGVDNVAHVAINYKRFRPDGTATLAFTRPEFVPAAVKALNKTILGGKTIKAEAADQYPESPRTRGSKGILEAAQRGVLTGNGPDGGIPNGGRNVVVYGLPGKIIPGVLSDNLRKFRLAGVEQGRPVVVKLAPDQAASTSRFLVRMASVSEAYRMVRALHMQNWRPDLHGDQFTIRAAVVS